jgi:type IV pilus assembly protein PilM
LARRRIGLDIGSTAVRAAEVVASGSRPRLVRIAQIPTPAGAVSNGEVRGPALVSEALRDLWKQGGFRSKDVLLGVSNQRVVVREVAIPWLMDKELRESLPFQVQEFVPISIEDAVLDYQIIEEFEQEGRRMVRLLLVAAQKVMIERMVQAVEGAGLTPVGLDLIPFAILRSVGSVGLADLSGEEGEEAVVDVGADVTSICVHAAGLPRFVRVLPSGGRDITTAVASVMERPAEEAEAVKQGRTIGLSRQMVDDVRTAIGQRSASFVDEIRSSLDFYASQGSGARISKVLLTGGGSKLSGLVGMLGERLTSTVVAGKPFHRLDVAVNADLRVMHEVEPLLAVAIGLAMTGVAA